MTTARERAHAARGIDVVRPRHGRAAGPVAGAQAMNYPEAMNYSEGI